jgi:hypothetical protein
VKYKIVKHSNCNSDAACKEKVDFLKTCDPFKVRGSSGRGGKYWGAVESEETATIATGQFEREQMPQAVAPAKGSSAFGKANPELKSMFNVFG